MTVQQFFDIPGGIHPAERKELSNRTPILRAPLPARLILPLSQHIGATAEPCESTISAPSNAIAISVGASQNFLRTRRKDQNSLRKDNMFS